MTSGFDINRFKKSDTPTNQYERQLSRLTDGHKEVVCIEAAVREAIRNIAELDGRSFVVYGEPQSGKTEMMICLTGKLLDEGYEFIVHLLNDSVDLLGQNLGRFKSSGLAPAARNFSEILDPAVKLKDQRRFGSLRIERTAFSNMAYSAAFACNPARSVPTAPARMSRNAGVVWPNQTSESLCPRR